MFKKLLLASMVAIASMQIAAQTAQIDGNDPEAVLDIVKGHSSAKLETDDFGDPVISGRIQGQKFVIWFYDCTDGKDCQTLSFSAAWENNGESNIELMNKWNQEKRFGRAFIDDDGDPALDWDVNLTHGVNSKNLDDTISVWGQVVEEFSSFLK